MARGDRRACAGQLRTADELLTVWSVCPVVPQRVEVGLATAGMPVPALRKASAPELTGRGAGVVAVVGCSRTRALV